jgi:2-C-methyl-D-erythritol 2,4-cyclodiphosphate synthase
MRIGIGYDIHRLESGRPLRLGGCDVPAPAGLVGHSDGDVLLHAICDALLGAAGLGDIGEHFPNDDPAYAGIDSTRLLALTLEKVRGAELAIANLDANLIAEQPRLGPHKAALRASLVRLLDIDPCRVSVKIRSNEGLDAVGQGQAIAAQAVVLLHPASAEPQGPPAAAAP